MKDQTAALACALQPYKLNRCDESRPSECRPSSTVSDGDQNSESNPGQGGDALYTVLSSVCQPNNVVGVAGVICSRPLIGSGCNFCKSLQS